MLVATMRAQASRVLSSVLDLAAAARARATRGARATSSSPASSLRRAASRSARRRALQKTIVVRCARISSSEARVDVRPDARRGLGTVERRARARLLRDARRARVMSSTGTMTSRSSALREPASTIVTGRGPVGGVAAEEARDLVERALRGREADALRRLRRDRVEPLEREREVRAALGGASAWISSTITVSTLAQRSRAPAR